MENLQFLVDKQTLEDALKSGDRVRVEVQLSPEMVEHLLSLNSDLNRKLNKERVKILYEKILEKGFIPADDFKFYQGKLVNGQHRLNALKKIYAEKLLKRPYPHTGIVVNISRDEAVIVDTAQTRTMNQRIYMGTGKHYHNRLRSAVLFSLNYHSEMGDKNLLNDEQVVREMESDSWVKITQEIPPESRLPNSYKDTRFQAPLYCALKEARDRFPVAVWSKFLSELNGESPSGIVQKIRGLIESGGNFSHGSTGRKLLYRTMVTFLKAYLKGNKTTGNAPSDWDD